jgi:hypothetical protein
LIEGQDTSIIKNKMEEIEINNSLKKEPVNPFINNISEVSKDDLIFSYLTIDQYKPSNII